MLLYNVFIYINLWWDQGDDLVEKLLKYESVFTKSIIAFYILNAAGSCYMVFQRNEISGPSFRHILWISVFMYLLFTVINVIKLDFIGKGKIERNITFFNIVRIIELLFLIVNTKIGISYLWSYIGIMIIAMSIACVIITTHSVFLFAMITSIGNILISTIFLLTKKHIALLYMKTSDVLFFDIMFGAAFIIISSIFAMIIHDNMDTYVKNKKLVEEIEEKYNLLAVAQQEIKNHYDKLKFTNKKLEDTNIKLSGSIGEFYTLHQISTAISSILNIKELLRYVNDVLIGVMGVQFSTIALYDDKKGRLKVHTTNITDNASLFELTSNINSKLILETLDNGKPFVNNDVSSSSYSFTSGREVNSFICMPLISKTRKLGVVLVEHKLSNAFGDDKKRLLEIICQQVSIAIENAALYQKMHELAITDWLTGAYNRVYFQQLLSKELAKASEGNYELCVSIFDIDLFKRFNDTYGHVFGDQVIKSVAETVSKLLKSSDVIARYGGEEFIILMPYTNLDQAYVKLENIRSTLENTIITDEEVAVSVTASFGVAEFPLSAKNDNDLLKMADSALYNAKNSGRNCVRVYC